MANTLANTRLALLIFVVFVTTCLAVTASKKSQNLISHVEDLKDFKKLLRTKTNLLVILTKTEKSLSSILPVIQTTAEEMKGKATLITIDCSVAKKLCRKLKMSSNSFDIKHYHDGEFNRNYDRKLTVKSMIKFLQDPKGDIPWDEDPEAENIVHVESEQKLNKMLKKQRLPMLLMFYAPWCGFCKRLKPEFSAAATELKGKAILAGLDADNPQFFQLRLQYNITGFPTIFYFENGKSLFQYGGENTRSGIVKWMSNPTPPKEAEKDASLFDDESNVEHLSKINFDSFLAEHSSVLVMFYAPWCGHCKKMKPEYIEAAATLKEENIEGALAAIDSTQESQISERFKIKGFPTVKYFRNGEYMWDFNERKASDIVSFMKDPKEPPPPPPPEPRWADTESDVHHLTAENFKTFLKKKKHSLVMFYAPWCGHCKKAKPEFTEAALQLKDEPKLAICAVDCTEHTSLCTAHDVKGYPTLKYFNYGKNPQDYMGGRTTTDFVNFLKSPNAPPTPEPVPKMSPQEEFWLKEVGPSFKDVILLSSTSFDHFISENPSALVFFYSRKRPDTELMKEFSMTATFLKAGESTDVFAAVDRSADKGLADKFVGSRSHVLKYFKNGEAMSECMGKTVKELSEFMMNPLADNWHSSSSSNTYNPNAANFQKTLSKNTHVFVAFHVSKCSNCERIKNEFLTTADEMVKHKSFAFAAVNCDFNSGKFIIF
ncbi:protein disulfide-isomerase A5 isoform X1 [Octopus bimaculoides]|nr:protein disulfide-isomerase A5 isoform X1 [Octopus bimaculoides]